MAKKKQFNLYPTKQANSQMNIENFKAQILARNKI